MRPFKSLSDRLKDQAAARERLRDRVREIALQKPQPKKAKKKEDRPLGEEPRNAARIRRPWAQVRVGQASVEYFARTSNERVELQPWTTGLTNSLLQAADEGGVSLCLVWPAKLSPLAMLHPLANMERLFAKDLQGMRTLFWPGSHASKAALQSVLASRAQLSALFRSLWVTQSGGSTELVVNTKSDALLGALDGLNYLHFEHPELPNPALAELVPTFVFDPKKKEWTTSIASPLERTLSKIDRLANRRMVRAKIGTEWNELAAAPGALAVLHHSSSKSSWKTALDALSRHDTRRPEVILLDATDAAARTSYNAVKEIPEFVQFCRQNGFEDIGTAVVTDDPKTFFMMRARIRELNIPLRTSVWTAEMDDPLLASAPRNSDWAPDQRSNSNFSVGIVDRDASQVALAFQRLAIGIGNEESPAYQALLRACLYILRLSNMPAGYSDLTAASAENDSFTSQLNAWTPVSLALQDALASGELNAVRMEVDKAVRRAEQLIDDWANATPMASRLVAEVERHAKASRHGLSIVLPNNRYVLLAHRFLSRTFADDWKLIEPRLEWHTLSSVTKTLSRECRGKHFVFVGMNSDVLRIILAHPHIPHGTAVLVAYRQAESTLTTLSRMKEVEELKAYRGRIGLLAQELERRLREVPNPIAIGKLHELPMTFKFDQTGEQRAGGDQTYYKFELEGGSSAYASGWVYRYAPDEDPPFRRAGASAIRPGDFIFDMSEELRALLESLLRLNEDGASSVVDPMRMLLKLYHKDVSTRCELMFASGKRSALAREVHARMIQIDPDVADCRPGRIYYWLELQAEGDTRPHAPRDSRFFKAFCRALEICDEDAAQYWDLIRKNRRLSQYLGRVLVSRYAEILFQPESASIYRKLSEYDIKRLQQEALHCVYRVENVVSPSGTAT